MKVEQEQKEIEEAIIGIVSRHIAPIIGLEATIPGEIVVPEIKKLLDKVRLRIGYTLEGEMVQTYIFVLASSESNEHYLSIDSGIEISIDPKIPCVFSMMLCF